MIGVGLGGFAVSVFVVSCCIVLYTVFGCLSIWRLVVESVFDMMIVVNGGKRLVCHY